MPTVKVVLVEDHDLFRLGVREFLELSPEYEVVGEADTARAGFAVIETTKPDVVIIDVALPGMDGVVATREILRRRLGTRVVMLSADDQIRDVRDALHAGALGYALKADEPATLLEALKHAVRGVRYLAPALVPRLAAIEGAPGSGDVLDVLSEREREIFRLAADCRTATEIASALCVARKTVDTHLHRINRKLGLHDRAGLVRLAVGVGLVHTIRRPLLAAPSRNGACGHTSGAPRSGS